MDFWNDYEGHTIADAFPLGRLLRPEGRSAFFSTRAPDGRPTVIRLIESHYDDEEILARWSAVSRLDHPNLLYLGQFGTFVVDGISILYVVMEPSDADLGQILRERRLTVVETRQVGISLVSALQALHSIGLVHEHIEAKHVIAVGDVVKLRSDCIREAPEGDEGDRIRARDVYELGLLLLQCLTLPGPERDLVRDRERGLPIVTNDPSLPKPFRDIIANAVSGRWGLIEISEALSPKPPPPVVVTLPRPDLAPQPIAPEPVLAPVAATIAAPIPFPVPETFEPKPELRPEPVPAAPPRQQAAESIPIFAKPIQAVAPRPSPPRRATRASGLPSKARPLFAALAILLVLILSVAAIVSAVRRHHQSAALPASPSKLSPADTATSSGHAPAPPPSGPSSHQASPAGPSAETSGTSRGNWRVIAYTYSREETARTKARRLAHEHPELKIEVFSPSGNPPFLVSVNGAMTRDEAIALRDQLRGNGFPHDLYAQNYTAH